MNPLGDASIGISAPPEPAAPRQALARGFWADAWARVFRRHLPRMAAAWLGLVALLAIVAPLVANSNPLLLRERSPSTGEMRTSSPLLTNLSPVDVMLPLGAVIAAVILAAPVATPRSRRATVVLAMALQGGVTLAVAAMVGVPTTRQWWMIAAGVAVPFLIRHPVGGWMRRAVLVASVAAVVAIVGVRHGVERLPQFDRWVRMERSGRAEAVYTLIPWSPTHARTELPLKPPGTRVGDHSEEARGTPLASRPLLLGTDDRGLDVASQLVHGCRLSISVGFVSAGIALLIGITLGAVMGWFGGWVDLCLYRVVEIFMAIPVLFLLIAAAGLMPDRSTYAMMAIIGCVSWTGAARFTRAEFLKLRSLEFVDAARCIGLPVRSILFRHMLPNGVTPVLVDASFAVAAAILAEATLSFLGYGPVDQASWGRLLSSAITSTGTFTWWTSILPGLAIFLTVLSYNILGEALRDAADPKLGRS